MSMFSSLTDRYRQLPRAGRWGFWLVAIVVVYFLAVEPAVDWSARKAVEVDRLEKSLAARTRLSAEAGAAAGVLERSIVAYGGPKPPRSNIADPSGYLSQKASDLAAKHGITVKRRTRRGNTPVSGQEWNGSKIERVAIELVVECDTEKFVALLKDLEASPDITQINTVRMNKLSEPGVPLSDSTVMQITLVPEMWILPKGGDTTAEPAAAPPATPEGVTQ